MKTAKSLFLSIESKPSDELARLALTVLSSLFFASMPLFLLWFGTHLG